jgi:integrase
MAVDGLNLRGSRYYLRVLIPEDLREVYGRTRVNLALGTSERREATLLGTIKRAEWLADFEAKRRELSPAALDEVTPELAAYLADRIRASLLAEDDRLRSDLPLLAEMVHVRRELDRLQANRLRVPQWDPEDHRVDDLSGTTEEERSELADLNAYLDGNAAVALAGRNLGFVLPLVRAEAAKLGVTFEPRTQGAREALLTCLQAYRTAHRERILRDAGEVVVVPTTPSNPLEVKVEAKPKTLRDVFDRWKHSGSAPRSKDSIAAYDRALRQFEEQHPSLPLQGITRDLGDQYVGWLRGTCGTPKTARDRLNAIKSLLKYAAGTLEWTSRHTWQGLDIKAPTTNKRRPWADAELSKLFGAPLHQEYALSAAKNAGADAAYWIPLLGLYTGTRLGELCQLRTADVQVVEDIAVLVLTDEGVDQSIKSEAGHRSIPIHSELVRLGFLKYAAAVKASGADSLWPALPLREGKPSDFFGRWFREHRKSIGLDAARPDFHCFRHTVRPKMRQAGFSESTMDKVTGHKTSGSTGTVVYDHWLLAELRAAVEAIRYPVLELPRVSPHLP